MLKKGNAVYRELNKKRIILDRRKPYKSDVAEFINEINLVDFVYTFFKLDGSAITREMITGMLKGNFYTDVSLIDHARVQRYREVYNELENMRQMKIGFSEPVFSYVYSLLENAPEVKYREDNPVIFEWNYNPPHPSDIRNRLNLLINWIERDGAAYEKINPLETPDLQESPSDFVLRAAYLHSRILSIYPYESGNVEIALIMMYYYFICKGYPVLKSDSRIRNTTRRFRLILKAVT